MNPGGRGCSEPRLRHCTPAWATERDSISKEKRKEKAIADIMGQDEVILEKGRLLIQHNWCPHKKRRDTQKTALDEKGRDWSDAISASQKLG